MRGSGRVQTGAPGRLRGAVAASPLRRSGQVGLGLLLVGGGTALVLALSARALPAGAFAVFATWLTLANLFGLAFTAVEMYLPLPLLQAREAGRDPGPLIAVFTAGVAAGTALLCGALLAASGVLVPDLLGDDPVLLVLLLAYTAVMAAQALQRAVAVGRDAFAVVGAQLSADGAVRALGAVLLAWSWPGAPTARGFAGAVVTAAVVGAVVGGLSGRGWAVVRGSRARLPLGPVALLGVASAGPLIVNNAGVPWLSGVDGVGPATVGAVAGALTLSRIPTLFVSVAYGPLLAPLSGAVTGGDLARFRAVLRRATGGVALVVLVFVLGFGALGPTALEVYLGPEFRLSALQLALMAAGSGLVFACVVEQAALGALAAWSRVATGWAAGLVVFGAVLLPRTGDPTTQVVLAVLLAPLTAYLVMTACRRRVQRRLSPGG